MKWFTKEQQESYENAKTCFIYQEKFKNKYFKAKRYPNVQDHWYHTRKYRGAAHNICYLKYSLPKKNSIAVHNGSNYVYHFIIKALAQEFKKQFTCFGENNEKYKTEKEVTRIERNAE